MESAQGERTLAQPPSDKVNNRPAKRAIRRKGNPIQKQTQKKTAPSGAVSVQHKLMSAGSTCSTCGTCCSTLAGLSNRANHGNCHHHGGQSHATNGQASRSGAASCGAAGSSSFNSSERRLSQQGSGSDEEKRDRFERHENSRLLKNTCIGYQTNDASLSARLEFVHLQQLSPPPHRQVHPIHNVASGMITAHGGEFDFLGRYSGLQPGQTFHCRLGI